VWISDHALRANADWSTVCSRRASLSHRNWGINGYIHLELNYSVNTCGQWGEQRCAAQVQPSNVHFLSLTLGFFSVPSAGIADQATNVVISTAPASDLDEEAIRFE
jgi:hypothetical protein